MAVDLDPIRFDVAALARGYRDGTVSPPEIVAATLRRIEQTQPALRAYVAVLADEALDAARTAERELRHGHDRGPLHGVPIAVKDIVDVAGTPTRCGSLARADAMPAATDAELVARLRAAGAVVVGKTTTQEFAAGVLSPPARNPWDPARVPGGSSGGSAVAVAVGAAVAALGTDTGGSIRIPAAACGVVGFKPTLGTLPLGGVFPLSPSLDTAGPLARTVDDATALYDALVWPNRAANPIRAATRASLDGIRIGRAVSFFEDRVAPDVRSMLDDGQRAVRSLGATVVPVDWSDAAAARAASFVVNRVETAMIHGRLARDDPERFARLNADLRLRIVAGTAIPAIDYLLALGARAVVRDSIARLFRDHGLDALLVPTLPSAAVAADDPIVAIDGDDDDLSVGTPESPGIAFTRLTMPFNATGQPVLALPGGFDRDGLPLGIQLAGRPGDEATLFRIGRAVETELGLVGRVPPAVAAAAVPAALDKASLNVAAAPLRPVSRSWEQGGR